MGSRMLCTDCGTTARPDTRLPGSDLREVLGWLCLGLPGWLTCAWRHALRAKVCPVCGGGALVREARARAEREGVAEPSPLAPPRVESRRGPCLWPEAWRQPRARLRRGGALVALGWAWLALQVAPGAHPLAVWLADPVVLGLAGLWALAEARRLVRERGGREACRAWDARGRALPLEVLGGL